MKSSIVRIAKSHCQKYSCLPIFSEIITLPKIATGRLVTYPDSLKCYRLNMRAGGGAWKRRLQTWKKNRGVHKNFGNHCARLIFKATVFAVMVLVLVGIWFYFSLAM